MRASSEGKTFFNKLNQVICCGHWQVCILRRMQTG
jgi:hypothetical protein